jgi:hypothetical protein
MAVHVIRKFRNLHDVIFGTPNDGDVPIYDQAQDKLVMGAPAGVADVAPYAVRVDDVGGTPDVSYVGEADPGTTTAAAAWRIKRLTDDGIDITIDWAAGDAQFDKIWDDRLSLTYS